MTNQYGLDVNYFKGKLELILRDIDYYTPQELSREFQKLIVVLYSEEQFDTAFDIAMEKLLNHLKENV